MECLKKLHKWISIASDYGLLSKQEIIDMIPPLLLQPKSNDIILEMCASPGNKTSQILESMNQTNNGMSNFIKGALVSNDVDYKRAWMITHQVKRKNTSGMLISNNAGQNFPDLVLNGRPGELEAIGQYDKYYKFDKILVDAPCSADGAIRKFPIK